MQPLSVSDTLRPRNYLFYLGPGISRRTAILTIGWNKQVRIGTPK
jgi:hypothetical protein